MQDFYYPQCPRKWPKNGKIHRDASDETPHENVIFTRSSSHLPTKKNPSIWDTIHLLVYPVYHRFFPTKWDSKTIFAPPLRQSDPPLLSQLAFQLLQGEGLEAQRVVIQVIDIYTMFGDDEHWVYHIIVLSFKIFGQSKIYFSEVTLPCHWSDSH